MGVTTNDPLLGAAVACVDLFYARLFRDWPEAVNREGSGYLLAFSGDRRLTGANHLWPYDSLARPSAWVGAFSLWLIPLML